MEKYIVLHTHTIMALLLSLLVAGMYVYLYRLQSNETGKRWFELFYLAQIFWQVSDMMRYSLHPDLIGSIGYKISVAFITIPSLAVLQIAYVQFLYHFLQDTFPRERRIVLYIMIFIGTIACTCNIWNEFYNDSEIIILHLIGFSFGLISNTWAMIVCLRKAFKNRNKLTDVYKGNLYQGINLINFILPCIVVLIFGFYSPIGYWSFFLMIWLGNIIQIIIFMNYSAVYINFQDKLVGFNFVIIMTVLMVLAITLYPPLPPDELTISLTQQGGLIKFFIVIIFSMIIIRFIFPETLKKTLTIPLQKLLNGVQQVNAGDLNTHVEIVQSDEIGILTTNFNTMTRTILDAQNKLKRYAENLELQVAERTSEIVDQSKQIQQQRDDLQKTLEDLKATQSQLIQSEKMASLGELTAGIAHEIQNPLNFVNNFSDVNIELVNEAEEEIMNGDIDEAKAILQNIRTNEQKINHHGKRADAIVKGMLQHSRKSTGEKEITDINTLCNEYLRLSFHGLRAKDSSFNATMETHFDPELPKINVIPQDVGRVLLNLINNAFYAVDEKKKSGIENYEPAVSISTNKTKDFLEVRVKDNGNGIPNPIKSKIFQPFFTTKPTGQGTGLGLSLSYDIVLAHGGELKVETSEAMGSEFIVQLPL